MLILAAAEMYLVPLHRVLSLLIWGTVQLPIVLHCAKRVGSCQIDGCMGTNDINESVCAAAIMNPGIAHVPDGVQLCCPRSVNSIMGYACGRLSVTDLLVLPSQALTSKLLWKDLQLVSGQRMGLASSGRNVTILVFVSAMAL